MTHKTSPFVDETSRISVSNQLTGNCSFTICKFPQIGVAEIQRQIPVRWIADWADSNSDGCPQRTVHRRSVSWGAVSQLSVELGMHVLNPSDAEMKKPVRRIIIHRGWSRSTKVSPVGCPMTRSLLF